MAGVAVKGLLRSGFFWVLVAEAAFAGMRIATRLGAGELPWAEMGAARFAGGALVAVALARARGASLRVTNQKLAWLRSGFGAVNGLCVFYALGSQRIAVGDVTTLSATTPLFVALLSWSALRERVSPLVWLGLVTGFAGIAVLVRPGFAHMGGLAGLAVLGAFFFAIALLSLRSARASRASPSRCTSRACRAARCCSQHSRTSRCRTARRGCRSRSRRCSADSRRSR